MSDYDLTVITPTTGRNSLYFLIDSLKRQQVAINHIILWDNKHVGKFLYPDPITLLVGKPTDLDYDSTLYKANNVLLKENMSSEGGAVSPLRAIGLLMATTEFVTFADDDVIWEPEHAKSMIDSIGDKKWVFCKRKMWAKSDDSNYEYLGVDEFESMGDEAKTSYKSVDNNCMMFRRRFGTSAACMYREATEYNDNKLMYDFLMKYAKEPAKTNVATINQVCPDRLINFFRENCTI